MSILKKLLTMALIIVLLYCIGMLIIGFILESELSKISLNSSLGYINLQTVNVGIDNVGIAPYAIRNKTFPCDTMFKGLKGIKNLHISWLHDSFGKRDVCLRRVLANKRLRTIHVHLLNQVCVRNQNCEPYESLYGYTIDSLETGLVNYDVILYEKIDKIASELKMLLDETLQTQTRCIIDPLLEANVSSLAATRLIKYLKKNYFPNCEFSWSTGSTLPKKATIREEHGSEGYLEEPCIRNLDGEDVAFPWQKCRFKSKYSCIKYDKLPVYIENHKQCEATFLWSAEMNCVNSIDRVSPRKRICEDNGVYKAFGDMIRQMQ